MSGMGGEDRREDSIRRGIVGFIFIVKDFVFKIFFKFVFFVV